MQEGSTDPSDREETVTCPECGEALAIEPADGPSFQCPACSSTFTFGAVDREEEEEAAARAELERRDEEELDGLRIRQLAAERRAAFRQRSYVIVVFGACAVAALQLLWMTYSHVYALDRGWGVRPIAYVLSATACGAAAGWLGRIVRRMTRDLTAHTRAVAAANDTFEPDFSTLADGSDRWRNLHDVK